MDYRFISVPLQRIADTDQTFNISTNPDKADLALSISAIGLLHPPILITVGDGAYVIVSGFRRLQTLKTLGWKAVSANILPSACSLLDCTRIAISDNSFQRALNVVEQSRAYALIQKYAAPSGDLQRIAQSVGLPDSETAMNRIMPVAHMSDALQHGILEGSIALPLALQVNQLAIRQRDALVSFFRQINANLNVQRELFDLIQEISRRDDVPLDGVIGHPDVVSIMASPSIPMPQKVQQVRRLLRTMRYPELSRAEDRYHQTLKTLKLNPRVQLQPPREFEGKSYRLTLTVESCQQLEALQPEIDKIRTASGLFPE